MDVLSDVLRAVHLRGGVFFTAHLNGPWAVESPEPAALARLLGVGEECLALFHLVAEGECFVGLPADEPVKAGPGSIVILPRGDAHRIGNDLSLEPLQMGSVIGAWNGSEIPCFHRGAEGPPTRLVCGYLRCDQRFNPLVGALPPLLVDYPADRRLVTAGRSGPRQSVAADDQGDWYAGTFRHLVEEAEAQRPGGAVILPRLAELMYIEVLRRYMRLLPSEETGWLAAARDPRIGHALRLFHERPDRDWSVPDLARNVGLSRSALTERFHALVGEPPMRYLSRWRMHLALHLLGDPELSVAEVAARVGFDSPVAFHRAFKRHTGRTPAGWRASHAAA